MDPSAATSRPEGGLWDVLSEQGEHPLVDTEDASPLTRAAADGRRRVGRRPHEAPPNCEWGASVTAAGRLALAVEGEGGHAGELAAVDGQDGPGDE